MHDLLKQFWLWAKKTPEQYAIEGVEHVYGSEEIDFPLFVELTDYAKEIVNKNLLDEMQIDELITIMAIDNEFEETLEYIESNSSEEQLKQIIRVGMTHLQPEARWQLAELISRRKPLNYMVLLSTLAEEENYVGRRARNCIEFLNGG